MKNLIHALLFIGLLVGGNAAAQSLIGPKDYNSPGDIQVAILNTSASTYSIQATGGATIAGVFQFSDDGVNWISAYGLPIPNGGSAAASFSGDGFWAFTTTGYRFLRVHITAISGTENITIAGTPGVGNAGVSSFATVNLPRTDHSGTITLGGAPQSLMAPNTSRHGCFVQNLSTGDIWVNEIGGTASAAQPSVWIPAGSYWSCALNATPSAISIFGSTTGQAFTSREW